MYSVFFNHVFIKINMHKNIPGVYENMQCVEKMQTSVEEKIFKKQKKKNQRKQKPSENK